MSRGTEYLSRYRYQDPEERLDPIVSPRELQALQGVADPGHQLDFQEQSTLSTMLWRMRDDLVNAADARWERQQTASEQEIDKFRHLSEDITLLFEHYDGSAVSNKQWENTTLELTLRGMQEISPKYQDHQVHQVIQELSGWQEHRNTEQLQQMFPPNSTVLTGRPEDLEQISANLPFTQQEGYTRLTGRIEEEQVRDQDVIGNLPMHLEALANSVTAHVARMPQEVRQARSQEGRQYTPEEMQTHTREMLQYKVRETGLDPADFPKDQVMVITQHAELVEVLRERGIIDDNSQVITHLDDPTEVRGMHIIGVAPTEMKVNAESVTYLPYDRDTGEYGEARNFTAHAMTSIPINQDSHLPIRAATER